MFVAPFQANLLITGQCNLSCRHCGVFSHGPLRGELTAEQWGRVLDRLAEAKILNLTLTGGEPFCRSDFPLILQMVRERPFRISINTNASLIDDEMAELIASTAPRLDVVMVSLDGDSPETHDLIRGPGAFDAMIRGVDELGKAKVPVCFYFTVNALNSHRMTETAALALRKGMYIKFNCFLDAGPETDPALNPTGEQVRTAARMVLDLASLHPGRITGTFLEMAVAARMISEGEGIPYSEESSACGGGVSKIVVMPDGIVSPCDHLPGVILGDLKVDSLEDILTGRRTAEFVKSSCGRARPWPECHDCDVRDFCPGPCPAGGSDRTGPGITCIRNYMEQ